MWEYQGTLRHVKRSMFGPGFRFEVSSWVLSRFSCIPRLFLLSLTLLPVLFWPMLGFVLLYFLFRIISLIVFSISSAEVCILSCPFFLTLIALVASGYHLVFASTFLINSWLVSGFLWFCFFLCFDLRVFKLRTCGWVLLPSKSPAIGSSFHQNIEGLNKHPKINETHFIVSWVNGVKAKLLYHFKTRPTDCAQNWSVRQKCWKTVQEKILLI